MSRPVSSAAIVAALAVAAIVPLAGCANSESASDRASGASTAIQQAATTPLSDLNLVQDKIPSVLEAAVKAPYSLPPHRTCSEITSEVAALDAALGADLDTPPTIADPGLLERGGAVEDATNGAIRSAGESVIPFRGWVRKLDGAERHSKDVAAAIAAGAVRRAYLKGVGQTLGCAAPAAPRPQIAASGASGAKG